MDEKITGLLKDILYQLHVITAQTFTLAANSDSDVKEWALAGLDAERAWMKDFIAGKGGGKAWDSGTCS